MRPPDMPLRPGHNPVPDCTSYGFAGVCLHQAAPRRLFGAARCIEVQAEPDPRRIRGCALRTPCQKPDPPQQRPSPPAGRIRRECAAPPRPKAP